MSAAPEVNAYSEPEEILRSLNVEYEVGPVNLADIDLQRSLLWNPREDAGGLNPYWVDTYTLAYANGENLPPIIVMRTTEKGKKLLVTSGNHRVAAAARAGLKSLPGYTTGPLTDVLRDEIVTEANRRVGYGLTESQRLEAAMRHIRNGATAADAARRVGLDARRLQKHVAQQRADERMQKLTPRWTRIDRAGRQRIDSIQSDVLAKKVADLAIAARLTHEEINRIAKDVNTARTDEKREEVIASLWEYHRPRIQSGKRPQKGAPDPAGQVRAALQRLAAADAARADVLTAGADEETIVNAFVFISAAMRRLKARVPA